MTGRDLLAVSLRQIGVIAPGEPLDASEASDGLAALNRMLGSWSTENLLINAKMREVFELDANDGEYSIGDSADLDTVRPQRIEAAAILDSNDVEYAMRILTRDEWVALTNKTATTTRPSSLYRTGSWPTDTILLYPIPSQVVDLVLYCWKPITQIDTLDTEIDFPPGYEDALITNLAIRLAPEYRKVVSPVLGALAIETKANIKRMNKNSDLLRVDNALLRGRYFDINTGEYT